MAERYLNEEQVYDIMWGATLLGGGGGGTMAGGMRLFEQFKKNHPDREISIRLIEGEDMAEDVSAFVTSSIGAPSAIKDTDITPHAVTAYNAFVSLAAKMDPPQKLGYSISGELGGYTASIPVLMALLMDVPLIDADGTGRAIPTLDTTLSHINGCATTPVILTDEKGNIVTIETKDTRDAVLAENLSRSVAVQFGMNCGMAGWIFSKDDVCKRLANGTISLCEHVGHVLRENAGSNVDVFAKMQESGIAVCRELCRGVITKKEAARVEGFDHGKVSIETNSGMWYTYYQNETLVICNGETAVMTVPEIIGYLDGKTGVPLTNADLKEGMEIVVGAIQVNKRWWQNPAMFDFWKPYLSRVGYEGSVLAYSPLNV